MCGRSSSPVDGIVRSFGSNTGPSGAYPGSGLDHVVKNRLRSTTRGELILTAVVAVSEATLDRHRFLTNLLSIVKSVHRKHV